MIKIGAKVVRQGRYITFQMAEAAISRPLFAEVLRLIDGLRPAPFVAFEAPYFMLFLKCLLASSLSALPAVKAALILHKPKHEQRTAPCHHEP